MAEENSHGDDDQELDEASPEEVIELPVKSGEAGFAELPPIPDPSPLEEASQPLARPTKAEAPEPAAAAASPSNLDDETPQEVDGAPQDDGGARTEQAEHSPQDPSSEPVSAAPSSAAEPSAAEPSAAEPSAAGPSVASPDENSVASAGQPSAAPSSKPDAASDAGSEKGQEQKPGFQPQSPRRVLAGKYLLEKEIARGAMGRVFQATQLNLKRRVAVKILMAQHAGVDFDKRFLLEAQMAAGLSHRNIVVVHDYGQAQNRFLFMAMEYLDGPTLGQLMSNRGPLPVGRACNIVLQVARALRCAHRAGVVHRDLKPGNIMLVRGDDDEGEVAKVLDFGLVKVFESPTGGADKDGEPLTRDGLMLGTPRYMAPEQIVGQPVDPRSDIYALGAVFYRMLTGRHPFTGTNDLEILNAQLNTNPTPLREQPGCVGLPPELEKLVAHCMKREPKNRVESASELIRRLREVVANALGDPDYRAMFQVGEEGGFPAGALALNSLTGAEGSSSGSRPALRRDASHGDISSSLPKLDSGLITPPTPSAFEQPEATPAVDAAAGALGRNPPGPTPPATPADSSGANVPAPSSTSGPHPAAASPEGERRTMLPVAAGVGLVLLLLFGAWMMLDSLDDPTPGDEELASQTTPPGSTPPEMAGADVVDPDAPPEGTEPGEGPGEAEGQDEPPAVDDGREDRKATATAPSKTVKKRPVRRRVRKARPKPKKVASRPPPPPPDKAGDEKPEAGKGAVAVEGTLLAAPPKSGGKKKSKRSKRKGEVVGGVKLATPDDVEREGRKKKSTTDPKKVSKDGTILADEYQ